MVPVVDLNAFILFYCGHCNTGGARRTGHGARARARLATGGSPVDSPSAEPSGAEICLARPSRKRSAGPKKHDFTWLYTPYTPTTLHYVVGHHSSHPPHKASTAGNLYDV